MKVAYVTMLFPAPAEVFATNDIRALEELGDRVSVHCLRPRAQECGGLEEHGLTHLPVTYYSWRSLLRGAMAALRWPVDTLMFLGWVIARSGRRIRDLVRSLVLVPRALEIADELQRTKPDVVHLFWGHYPALVGYLVARRCPGVVVSVFLGAYDLSQRYGGSGPVARAADIVWTHADVNVPELLRLGVRRERIRVVHRGLDVKAIPPRPRPPMSGRRVITVGRLIREKAFDDVLVVFARLRARWPDSTLVVVGDGPERARLERMAAELGIASAVSFTGHVPHARVLREMADSDVMVFLSRKESERLPNVVKEAMACECVCVASDTPGMDELITHGVTGYVVAQGDTAAVIACIDSLFSDPEPARALANRARRHVLSHFDASASMRVYHREWEERVNGQRSRACRAELQSVGRLGR